MVSLRNNQIVSSSATETALPYHAQIKTDFDVIIVGLGPTGATLANLLGICGVSTMVLEREADTYELPRAVHFDDEVMRIFQSFGMANEIAEITRINPGMRFVDKDGDLLLDWPRPQEIGKNGWHASSRFHQPELEAILRKSLLRFDHVKIKTGVEVVSAEDEGNSVSVRYKDRCSGEVQELRAKYLVGCDGARSIVRKCIGTPMEDLGFNERWLVLDVILKKPKPELGEHTIQYCNPARPATYVRGPGERRRWEISVLEDEDSDEISTDSSIWQFLSQWLTPQEAEIERKAVYTFRSSVAEKWRTGRLLIAGDAAHLTPPFMGQGMCAGIRDAANLAWKLALCLRYGEPDFLLDSYQRERRPHVREYIETAVRLGGLINTCGTQEALRAAFPSDDGSARMKSIAPRLGPGLEAGNTTHTGRLFPQPRLTSGTLMDDHCGYAPAVLINTQVLPVSGELEAIITASGSCIISSETEPDIANCLRKMKTAAALIRPDRYVFGTANNQTEFTALIENLLPSPLA